MVPFKFSLFNLLISKRIAQSPKFLFAATYSDGSPLNRSSSSNSNERENASRNSLYNTITIAAATSRNGSVLPFLDRWVEEGKKVRGAELQSIIRCLRAKKRFAQALEISEWMSNKQICPFLPGDRAVLLDLIGHVRGLSAAEGYFDQVGDKSEKMYGALLSCYIREGLLEKSLSHLQKMKDMGLATNPLAYNNIMCLYANVGQLEKLPDVLLEMKQSGVSPNNFSYRICINACGSRSDYGTMEKLLKEMESQPGISMDWSTYTTVASHCLKGGLNEKASHYLEKAEEKVDKDGTGYKVLITLHASLGNKSEVMRLWARQKAACKRQINIDYMTVLGSLVKLGELEEAENLYNEWESTCLYFDFRVLNVLLIGYTQGGMVERAEEMLERVIERGMTPIPNSWSIITAGYLDKKHMDKAVKCMKRALELHPQNLGWLPKPRIVSSILEWLGDEGDVEEVEAFVKLLNGVVPISREIYHVLMKANIRHGNEVDGILQSMRADNIDEDEETKKILGSRWEIGK